MFCLQVCSGNFFVWSRSSSKRLGEELRQILRHGSSEDQILLQQGELLSREMTWKQHLGCLLKDSSFSFTAD